MIYEIRTYTLMPGSVAEFEKRFESALPSRLQYSELAAFWHTEFGPLNEVIHVWPYDDLAHQTAVRRRLAEDPGWPPKSADLILTMQSEIFTPAAYSPKLGGGQKLGNVYEMRIYQYKPGSIPTVAERFKAALGGGRTDLSPVAACMSSELGLLNVWVHIWPYASLDERERVRRESRKLDTWPPKTRELLVSQRNKILIPASFSPMA